MEAMFPDRSEAPVEVQPIPTLEGAEVRALELLAKERQVGVIPTVLPSTRAVGVALVLLVFLVPLAVGVEGERV